LLKYRLKYSFISQLGAAEGQMHNIRLFITILALVLLLPFQAAWANDKASPSWEGVWDGRIGGLPVRLCLFEPGYGDSGTNGIGAYYYQKHLQIIHLDQSSPKVWREEQLGKPDAKPISWKFDNVGETAISGTWLQDSRRLPIQFKRVLTEKMSVEDEWQGETSCGAKAFIAPRATPITITKTAAQKDGKDYDKLIKDVGAHFEVALEYFALREDDSAAALINARLKKAVNGFDGTDYLSCMSGALSMNARDGDFSIFAEPAMIGRRWMSATVSYGDYCGGAHPNHGSYTLNFDLDTGKEERLITWFAGIEPSPEQDGYDASQTIPGALRDLVMARWPSESGAESPECKEVAGESNYWDLRLSRDGMVFTPSMPHVLTACEEPVTVPYTELAPLLTERGKKKIASVVAELN
jgi:hypothetical protein